MLIVKIGGGRDINHEAIFADLAELAANKMRAIVVHGGNYEMDALAERLNVPQKMITSVSGYQSRYTDAATMEVFQMAYCGKVNKHLVALGQQAGLNVIGLSGMDGRLLVGPRKKALRIRENGKTRIVRDDMTGKIETVNVELLNLLCGAGYTPLICPPALSDENEAINVDGDRAAARIAMATRAEKLIILSNVPGLLRDVSNESSLIDKIDRNKIDDFAEFAEGRMKKKIMGAVEAIDGGVTEVIFADARREKPIRAALEHRGTLIH